MDSLGQNYFGVSSYNSALNKNLTEFIQTLWPNLERLSPYLFSYQQTVYETEMASLLNVKYLLSHNPNLGADGFTLLKQFGEVYIYENENTQSIGKFYTSTVSQSELPEDLSQVEIGSFLTEHLIVDGEGTTDASVLEDYTLTELTYTLKNRLFRDKDEITIPIKQKKLSGYDRVYLEFTLELTYHGVVTIQLNDSSCYYLECNAAEPKTVRLRVPKDCTQVIITSTTPDSLYGTVRNGHFYGSNYEAEASDAAEVFFAMPEKDTLVTGTVDAKTDGTLLVTIPYEDGWTAYVDGVETKALRADCGFQALSISAGHHEITFRYQAPGLQTGILISLVCVGGFLVLVFRERKKMRQA